MEQFISTIVDELTKAGLNILYAMIILIIGLKLSSFLIRHIAKGRAFKKLDESVQSFLRSLLKITCNILVILTAAMVLGVPLASFVTVFASAGVAISLALQGALGNLAGGLMILIFKPFRVGDYIKASNDEGTVKRITIFYTYLTTVDNKQITIPNGSLTNNTVTNYSAEETRRVDLTFCISYDSDIDKAKDIVKKLIEQNEYTISEPPANIHIDKQNDSSIDIGVWVWCRTADYWSTKFSITESVKKAFDAHKISIPFPQMDIHIK